MRRLLHTSWISLLALVLLVVGAIYYVGWTVGGLQRLVSLTNRRLGPVSLEITGARGTLHDGVHIDQLVIDHQRVHIVVQQLDGRVALLPLLWQTIRVIRLDAAEVKIQVLPHHDTGGPPWQPHFLIGLLNIEAESLNAAHVEVISPGGTSIAADQTHVAAQIGVHEIRIFDSTLHYLGVEARSAGSVFAADPVAMKGAIRLSLEMPGQPAWLANSQIDGNLDRLGITGVFLAPFNADFRGDAQALSGDWHWQGKSVIHDLDLRAWGVGNALGVIGGTLQLRGSREGFHASGALDPPGLKSGPLAVEFTGSYVTRVLRVERATFTHRTSGAELSTAGEIAIVDHGPRLALHGQWHNFRWPLASSAAHLHSGSGSYVLEGLRPFAFTASGALQVLGEPELQFRSAGRIEADGLNVPSLSVDAYDGQGDLKADLRWSPAERWSASGVMRNMNVAKFRPGVVGRVGFLLDASGLGFGQDSTLQAKFTEINGTVRGQRASGRAGIALSGDDWLLQQVHVQLGATRVDADGRLGVHSDLQFAINAEDLALFHAGARGHLQATGRYRSDPHNPLLQATVSGSGLSYDNVTLQGVDARVDFDPQGSGHANLNLQLNQFKAANHQIDRLRFVTEGTATAHHFSMQLGAATIAAQATGTGNFNDGVWRTQLSAFTVTDGSSMHLTLVAPTSLLATLNGDELRLDPLCLHDELSTLCLGGAATPAKSSFNVSATNVPLKALTAGVSDDTDFDGRVSLQAGGEALGDAPWSGTLTGNLSGAALHHHLRSGRIESFDLGSGRVQAALDTAGLSASVLLDAAKSGNISGHLVAHSNVAPWQSWPLRGELQVQTQSLGFIDSYVTQVDRVSGLLKANLSLAGTLGTPAFNGELKLSDAEVDAYQINLALRELNFDARLNDNVLQLDGRAKVGAEGHTEFKGELAWRNGLPFGQLHLGGENLRVVNIPEARVQASPDVTMKFTGRRVDVTGSVTLPYARLQRPDQLTNAVRASNDEVIVSATEPPPTETFHVFSDLTLRLGERVTIDTLGLNGRLSGSLRSVADDSGFSRATGELQVEEGKYTAYGRKLDIEHGRLKFNDGPLSDPAIDLRAIKKFPDITAGVNVRGTLREPRMTFYSEPAVSQSQIVSLLLAGGSLESVQNTDPTQAHNNAARNNLLLQSSALLFQQFGGKVGLDDVSVESGLNNDTSLVLGRYLSPRLYISYGIGLAETINTIKMRYTIGDHWTIKTEAGTARSADLVYTIER